MGEDSICYAQQVLEYSDPGQRNECFFPSYLWCSLHHNPDNIRTPWSFIYLLLVAVSFYLLIIL